MFLWVHICTYFLGGINLGRIFGAIGMHIFSFYITKQCTYHFTIVSAVCDSSSCSSSTLIFSVWGVEYRLCALSSKL